MSEYTIRVISSPPPTVVVQADPSFSTRQAIEAAAEAEASEIAAAASAGAAATSASEADTSAGAANTSAIAAAASAVAASDDADAAQASADAAAATLASSLKIDQNLADLDNAATALTNLGLTATAADLNALVPIGMPFAIWDHITGCPVPSNAGAAKFIKLTAGLTGASAYNEGLLGSESVTGTAPLVEATATILVGPMTGQTVHLINTEEAFLRARETSGALQQDQMQRITGALDTGTFGRTSQTIGALSMTNTGRQFSSGALGYYNDIAFNSANSPDARVSSTTAGETRSKNVSATYYLRIA